MGLQYNMAVTADDQMAAKAAGFAQPDYFSPDEYFLGILGRAASAGSNVRISHSDKGSVTLIPSRREYHSSVQNMKAFCEADVDGFSVVKVQIDKEIPEDAPMRSMSELFWQAAFYASKGRLVQSRMGGDSVHIYDVISMRRWPNLTRLPQTPNTMRICALLTRQPSSILLVSRKLGIPPEEVYQVYSAACGCGLIQVVSSHLGEAEAEARMVEDGDSPLSSSRGLFRSLFSKISGL